MRRVLYMKGECMMLDEKESIAKLKDYATRILKLCEDYERNGKINKDLMLKADPRISYGREKMRYYLRNALAHMMKYVLSSSDRLTKKHEEYFYNNITDLWAHIYDDSIYMDYARDLLQEIYNEALVGRNLTARNLYIASPQTPPWSIEEFTNKNISELSEKIEVKRHE